MVAKAKNIIGQAEIVEFPELAIKDIYARIDTGARTSAIWASSIERTPEGLVVVFFGPGSKWYTGEPVTFTTFDTTVVASSNGVAEERFKIRLLMRINGRRVRAWFTLADRSTQVYPILVGRNILRGKFLVDVSQGTRDLLPDEQKRTEMLKQISKEA